MGFLDYIGGTFGGGIDSNGPGRARAHWEVKDAPIVGDIPLGSWSFGVPGMATGGVVGQHPGQTTSTRRDGGGQMTHPLAGRAREVSPDMNLAGPGDRQGGADAPTRGSSGHEPTASGKMAHPVTTASGPARRRHEIAPGVPCPTCATGETTPVR